MTPDIIFDLGKWRLTFDFPREFEMFGQTLYWYGSIVSFGFFLAMLYAYLRRKRFGIRDESVTDMALFAVPFAIIGARAYYMLFSGENWTLWDAVEIWNGGLAVYGGVIGGFVGTLLFGAHMRRKQRKKGGAVKFKLSPYFDLGALGLLIGQTLGRWGNFVNREAYGRETTLPWAMGLDFADGVIWVHPTFLYEVIWNLAGLIWMHIRVNKRKFDGEIFAIYLGWYGLGRFFIEALRTDSLYLFNTGVRVSQLVAAICVAVSVVLIIYNRLIKRHTPADLYINQLFFAKVVPPSDETDLDDELEAVLKEIKKDSETL
jgi:phosphatidylglycerol:prolipoprotein diacylglycerol transferase